jgi:ABC-type nickel/cobalt efflux system permease component RcnA
LVKKFLVEKHFTATDTVRDIMIGMSYGLTVPFALAAGLSGVVSSTSVVIIAARTVLKNYMSEKQRENPEIVLLQQPSLLPILHLIGNKR